MAGDWIKMRGNLWDDPRVSAIVDAAESTEAAVIGALYWLWSSADQHTENGTMPGLTIRQIDRKTGVQGFGSALCAIGWLIEIPGGVELVNFQEHNGSSAKKRCEDAKRKSVVRKTLDKTWTKHGNLADKSGIVAELEKEKEKEKSIKPPTEVRRAARKCPADFQITEDMRTWAQLECPTVDIGKAFLKFRDHTFKTARTDWDGTLRNWLRKDSDDKTALPAWREQQREQTQKAAPLVALGTQNPTDFFTELGAKNVAAIRLG